MVQRNITVLDLLNIDLREHGSIPLRCLCGQKGLTRTITLADLNCPGLALSVFFDSFAYQSVQL